MTTSTPLQKAGTDRKIEKKWGAPLIRAGFTAIPNVIIQRQYAIGLSPLDLNILLQLLAYWWEPKNLPHPSKTTIAKAIGVHPRTVQKRIAAMEKAKFIQRKGRRTSLNGSSTNEYDFSGLIEAAEPYALEELEEIEQRKRAKAEKLARKRPKLGVVRSKTA
jgi:helix-turn-helix protein